MKKSFKLSQCEALKLKMGDLKSIYSGNSSYWLDEGALKSRTDNLNFYRMQTKLTSFQKTETFEINNFGPNFTFSKCQFYDR